MPDTPTLNAQVAAPPSPAGRSVLRLAADGLLVVAALSSALWACMAAGGDGERFQRSVVLDAEPHHSDARWYIDSANIVRWPGGSAEGATSLSCVTTSVPADVVVLVHPDSLMEPLVRTIEVLQQAGAERVHVAMSPHDPFPRSGPESLP